MWVREQPRKKYNKGNYNEREGKSMKKRGKRFLAAAMSAALVLPALPVQAADPAQTDDSWIATPYTREDGTVLEGLEEAVQGKAH